MPTYEYQCETCGAVFDILQSIKAAPLRKTRCEACGATRPVKRLIGTGGGVIFKGSGFYQTDYRSENYKKSAESETKSKESPAGDSKSGGTDKGTTAAKDTTAKVSPAKPSGGASKPKSDDK